jgi:hypothetical protein
VAGDAPQKWKKLPCQFKIPLVEDGLLCVIRMTCRNAKTVFKNEIESRTSCFWYVQEDEQNGPVGLADETIVFVHAQRDAGAAFDEQRDVFPKLVSPKTDQRPS